MTRDSDKFVALRPRFEMARRDHADMFISLHADANPFCRPGPPLPPETPPT
jgi:N-acetylmuramoyl-L-alanine amidase